MKITGEMLKSERINSKLSVQDIAQSLKLSSKIVTAIEEGNLSNLPAKTFVRGFVKSYAQLLKLDPDVVLRQFQEEMGSTNPLPKVPPPTPIANENNITAPRPALKHTAKNYSAKNVTVPSANLNSESPKKIILMISIAVILITLLVISNKIMDSYAANPVAVDTPAEILPVVDTTAAVESSTSLSADISAPAPVAAPSSEDTTAASTASAPTQLEDGFKQSSGQPVEILLEAKKDTELHYAKGDSVQFTPLKLYANQIQVLRSKVGLYLKAADGGAFKISVNGADLGFAGSNNKAIKLSF